MKKEEVKVEVLREVKGGEKPHQLVRTTKGKMSWLSIRAIPEPETKVKPKPEIKEEPKKKKPKKSKKSKKSKKEE